MDFRFHKIKVIGSIVIPLIIWIFVFTIGPLFRSPPVVIRSFLEIHDLGNIFAFGNISLFIIEIIFVYVLWSLVQKK